MAFKNSSILPTPTILSMSSVGIDISNQTLRFVELVRHGGELRLGHFGEKKIGIEDMSIFLSDDSDTKVLTKIIRDISKENNISFVHSSVIEESAYLFKISLPKIKPSEIRGAISLSLEQHVPLSIDDVVFDYELIEENDSEFLIQVTVLPVKISNLYEKVFNDAGVSLLSLELESQAVSRALIKTGDEKVYMIIDFGEKGTGISISKNGVVLFASTIDFGGKSLTMMIQKELNVSFEEAEELKRAYGLRRDSGREDIFGIILSQLAVLRDEINRHFVYWHTHKDEEGKDRPKISEIVILGGNSNLYGLLEYLEGSLSIKISMGNVWTNVNSLDEYIPEIPKEESLSFATAIGLALKGFIYE